MSLLMDALKKAELAKGTAAEVPPDSPSSPQTTTPGTAPATLPDLPLELEKLDGEFSPQARSAPPPAQRPQPTPTPARQPPPVLKPAQPVPDGRTAAQNAFAAKQPPAAVGRTFAVTVGAATLLAIAAIGIYFWFQLRPVPNAMTGIRPLAALSPSAPVANPPSSAQPAMTEPPRAGAVPEPPRPEAERTHAPTTPKRYTVAASTPAGSSLIGDNDSIRITTSHLKVDPALTDGFAAFQSGDIDRARTAYERALQDDPRNADALRGAAAVALREGRRADAEAYYRRLIEADPLDAVAQAGLVGLDRREDPVAAEGRLKTLLTNQPDAAVLHFALGNLYARQSRWSEAQQAYFDAVAGDGANPDYLFNLAVSLDQLHKTSLAAQYYRQALAAAAKRPAAFDPAAAEARLRRLQP